VNEKIMIKNTLIEKRKILENYLLDLDKTHSINGVISIEINEDIIFRKAFGFANLEYRIPNRVETKFLLGSNSKLFTALAMFQLIEAGKISLESKIMDFFPKHQRNIQNRIRVHHLLSHTGGIIDFWDLTKFNEVPYAVQYTEIDEDILLEAIFNESKLPINEYHYSNSGYYILGLIIERITGLSYSEYVSRYIFDKLEMKDSGVYDQDSIIERLAYGYKLKDTGMTSALYFAMGKFYACGGIYSTLDDLRKWHNGLLSNRLITSDSFRKMCTSVEENYGYGCRISEAEGDKYIWHDGFVKGHYSHTRLYPSKGIQMKFLKNSSAFSSIKPDELNPNAVCTEIAKILNS